MPRLLNERHERFARVIATGVSKAEAARQAGYPDNGHDYAGKQGHRLMKKDEVALRVEELIRKAENVQELSESAIKLGVTEMAIDEKNAPRDRLKAYELLGKAKDRPMWGDRSQSDDPPSRQQVIAQFAVFLPVVGAPKVVEMLKLAGIEATEGELSG